MSMKLHSLVLTLTIALTLTSCSTIQKSPLRKPATPFAPIGFSVIGPNQTIYARWITLENSCPEIKIDGAIQSMQTRITPEQDPDFPIRVCESEITPHAKKVSIAGTALPLPKTSLKKMVVIGDSGCRLKGTLIQDCHTPAAWPFAQISENAYQTKPDLVIHTGDYFYREFCDDPNRPECQNTPLGDHWESWHADLFKPAENLLKIAPWIMVRGNHESCTRGGKGYFKILNPGMGTTECPKEIAPYSVKFKNIEFAVMDSSAGEPDQKHLQGLKPLAVKDAILLTHRPIFGLQSKLPIGKLAGIRASFHGHWHTFHYTAFKDGRAPQYVIGNGGDLLDTPDRSHSLKKGAFIDGTEVTDAESQISFGFVTLKTKGKKWILRNHDVEGKVTFQKPL
jgi:hypothetical protein